MILKSSHSPCFVVMCDECGSEVEWLQMRNGKMVIDDGKVLTVKGEWYEIPINHHVVCEFHSFDPETGTWNPKFSNDPDDGLSDAEIIDRILLCV